MLPRDFRIVSGGQAGADRAALDWAIARDIPHGGWCPRGRKAEDGVLHSRYRLRETGSAGYAERTRRNVEDADATLIVNLGVLDGGSLETLRIARARGKPALVLQLDEEAVEGAVARVRAWLEQNRVVTLNVAGPRESKRPGIYRRAFELFERIGDPQ